MKRGLILFCFVFMLVFSLAAQDFTLNYVEGSVSIKEGNSWYDVFIGDMVDSGSMLKLGPNSMVEIDAAGNTLILNKPGSYKVGDLLEKAGTVSAWDNNPVFKKFLSGDNARSSVPTAVMGVRGSATETDDVEWLSEDTMVMDDAKAMIKEGDFKGAIDYLEEEMEFAFSDDLSDYNYYIGYSYYMMGSSGKALSYLDKVKGKSDSEYYEDFVVMKGSLLMDTLAYEEALDLFNGYLRNDDVSATAQAISYLSATALKGLGKDAEAQSKLETTVKMNPSSEIGRMADGLLKQLR